MRNYWTELEKKSRKELKKALIDWSEQLRKIEDEWAKIKEEAEEIDTELCTLGITRKLVREHVERIKKLLKTSKN